MTISKLTLKFSDDEPVRRFEVFTGTGRRRDWSDDDKARIVAETRPAWPISTLLTARLSSRSGIFKASPACSRWMAMPAFCWSHVRRKFYDLAQGGPALIATEALARIATLYQVEAGIRGCSAEERCAARQTRSRPIVAALEPWLKGKLRRVSQKSKLADVFRRASLTP